MFALLVWRLSQEPLNRLGRNGNRYAIHQGIEHGGVTGRQVGNLLQFVLGNIRSDLEMDPDSFESRSHPFVQIKESVKVNVAFDGGLEFVDLDAASGGMV